ncbi:MAG: Large extracellular alpha-helical protein, partial [Labilithrix sp.]|nr:Large extracellular alpha-helical protein [Labilithrix sp.]
MMLRILDGRGEGVSAKFKVSGDGLATTVTTDAKGEAEIGWNAPAGVGATRNVGPCAGGVAAAITIRPEAEVPALRNQRDGFVHCVPIDRDADGIVRIEPTVARPGDKVRITVHRPRAERRSFSAVLYAQQRAQSVATWLEGRADGTASGEVIVPADAGGGVWHVSAVAPEGARASRVAAGMLLVVPKVAPLLTAKRVSGRATPGGTIDVEAVLSDGQGRGLPGSVSLVVVDAFGGGDAKVTGLDTRSVLCSQIGVDADRCSATLAADPSTEALRRALLSKPRGTLLMPANDPGAHASIEMKKAFAEVLRSLEGAVFEATKTAQTLIDVRRKENGRWVFNPEMFTLVTEAMNEPPVTPGGEKLTLTDLSAVDPQVTFDNVARRVTRLKLFRVLAAVRAERSNRGLDPDEPVFKDPNALLRRLVRSGSLTEHVLLDPWGGTIQFVRSKAPPIPFLTIARGFELRAPGPDGVVDTADDVRDPFERVLRSGSPYADAVEEDRIVDAKWDMVVSEETVQAWQRLFEELTGTTLGNGIGLSGVGEGGGGRGEGIGLGSVGTLGHGS